MATEIIHPNEYFSVLADDNNVANATPSFEYRSIQYLIFDGAVVWRVPDNAIEDILAGGEVDFSTFESLGSSSLNGMFLANLENDMLFEVIEVASQKISPAKLSSRRGTFGIVGSITIEHSLELEI